MNTFAQVKFSNRINFTTILDDLKKSISSLTKIFEQKSTLSNQHTMGVLIELYRRSTTTVVSVLAGLHQVVS